MNFKNIGEDDIQLLNSYYKNCSYHVCEYSSGMKLMWKELFECQYAVSHGCLIVKEHGDGETWFNYPVAGEDGDIEAALDDIDRYCADNAIKPVFAIIPEEVMPSIIRRYPYTRVICPHKWKDYFYLGENFRTFSGRKFSGQRNHINKFKKLYPDAVFRPLTPEDDELLSEFWKEFEQLFSKTAKTAQNELIAAKRMLSLRQHYCSACMVVDNKIVGLALGEICGDMMIVHIEKALYTYEGIYPTIVQEFARLYETVYSNREDDAGDKGLRTSKMQYLPYSLREKYKITVGTEADLLDEIPTIETDRLVLNEITDADAAAYSAVCTDDALNKYWGYDYRKDLHGELTDDYFVRVAKHDFDIRLAVNFAIRLDGKFIGEAVVYNFDYKGGVEIGCRISREYANNGYGREAFAATAEWALYRLGAERVVAKCFKENTPSFKMLSSCMKKTSEDDVFYYFEKRI